MTGATAEDVSRLDTHEAESHILREHPHNVLIEGTAAATDALLRLLQAHVGRPIMWHRPDAPLDLPSGDTRALILRDAATLSVDDQQRLLTWIDGAGSQTQIISMSERPLFVRVADGLFDAALYYRLNVMLLRVGVTA
jgi:sigma-54-interacting transcriptional regulator